MIEVTFTLIASSLSSVGPTVRRIGPPQCDWYAAAMYDLVIVGGGIAGMCAALAAPEGARIVVIDKGEAGAGSSPLAQGGLAAAVGPEDSPELHAKDTVVAGAGICDEQTVEDICAEGPAAV